MKVSDVDHCRFEYWYPLLKRVTFASVVIELPVSFLHWLRHVDGIAMDDAEFPITWNGTLQPDDELLLDDTPLELLQDARDQRDSLRLPNVRSTSAAAFADTD
jgi:hypothetical protein